MFKLYRGHRAPVPTVSARQQGEDIAKTYLDDVPSSSIEKYRLIITVAAAYRQIADADLPEFVAGIRGYLERRDREKAAYEAEQTRRQALIDDLLQAPDSV